MIDPQDDLTDVRMPETGTEGHATLLLAGNVAGRAGAVPLTELRAHTRSMAHQFRSFWRATAREPGAEKELTDVAVDKLLALQLVARDGDGTTGQVKRLVGTPQRGAELLADVMKVVAALPGAAEPRGRLAARLLGSPHALDDGRPVTSLVFGAARVLSGLTDGKGAKWRRDVWSAVGVLPDDLSSSVLLLGFPGDRKLPLGRVLGEWRSVGEPASLTLRQLRAPGPVELTEALGITAGQ